MLEYIKKYSYIPLLTISILLTIILFFKIKHEQQINQELQIEKIKSKTLSDEINRASTTFVSKADLEKIIKEYGVNYSVIKNDLDKLHAEIIAINKTAAKSQEQRRDNQPSTNSENITPPPNIPISSGNYLDIHNWYGRRVSINLREKFQNTEVPIGNVYFEASEKNPWDYNIYSREYVATTTISETEDRTLVVHNSLEANVDGKNYKLPITSETKQVYPERTFRFNPSLYLGFNTGLNTNLKYDITTDFSIGLFSFGKYKVNPELSLFQIGVGYSPVTNNGNIILTPIAYNIGGIIPFIKNTYLYGSINYSFEKAVSFNLGIKVQL